MTDVMTDKKSVEATVKPAISIDNNTVTKTYSTIRQGTSTNALTKFRAVEGKNLKIDGITGEAFIKKGNFVLAIKNYKQLSGLKTSTHQLLDAITIALTENGAKSPTVTISLSDYMKRRGLKNRKEAKKQVIEDMNILTSVKFTWEEKSGKTVNSYTSIQLSDKGEVRKNGDISFTFGATFYSVLMKYAVMPYPSQLQTLNSKRNPNSYYLLRKIAEHKNMNVGKKNENIISVQTLLSAAPFIPDYEYVKAKSRNFSQKIIEPFERDMNALEETLNWHYCHTNNEPLTDDEVSDLSYNIFKDLMIYIVWKFYPDQTARLQRKIEIVKPAKKGKE